MGVNFTMWAEGAQIQEIQRHLNNIEREVTELKKLVARPIKPANAKQLELLRHQLIAEGFEEELVQLVGVIPLRERAYKKEILDAISERLKSKP